MASPIEPKIDQPTGRLLTEWFEYPEYTREELFEQACELEGVVPDDLKGLKAHTGNDKVDPAMLARINAFVAGRSKRKFVNNMSNQEVQARLNEATKMVDPVNMKFLPDDVRARTGLEINPLWLMECMVRSGVLTAKEQMSGLKELAAYTHSKAPSVAHNTNTNMSPEDWLLELANEEYKVVEDGEELKRPMQPVERGSGKRFDSEFKKKAQRTQALQDYATKARLELEAEFDADFEDLGDDDGA